MLLIAAVCLGLFDINCALGIILDEGIQDGLDQLCHDAFNVLGMLFEVCKEGGEEEFDGQGRLLR